MRRTVAARSRTGVQTINIVNLERAPAQATNGNPSALRERLPIALLVVVGCVIGTYLALYQFGIVAKVWEPFFGDGSERVLHSFVSRLLPVRDAALGAAAYALEFILGAIGGEQRWRTKPWLVLGYGTVVAVVALSGIALTAIQVFVIRATCTLCLTSAAISLMIAWLAREEVLAAVHVLYAKRETK